MVGKVIVVEDVVLFWLAYVASLAQTDPALPALVNSIKSISIAALLTDADRVAVIVVLPTPVTFPIQIS
jgi:hypothetical protein